MNVRLLLALLVLSAASARAEESGAPPHRFFAGVGLYRTSGAYAFDRITAARPRRGALAGLLQAGGVLYRDDTLEAAAHYLYVVDANADGADIQMPLGELRFRMASDRRFYFGLGGGISRGKGRKQSFVETVALGLDIAPRSFVELRAVTDEGDSGLQSLTFGIRF